MAFLRKHRDRYWLVHNFRQGSKVHQRRIYAFDLQADLEQEIIRAQSATAALPTGPLPATWVKPVRQHLHDLQAASQRQRWEQQVTQVRQHVDRLVHALEHLEGSPADKQQVLWECVEHLQQMVASGPLPQAPMPALSGALPPNTVSLDNTTEQGTEIAPDLYIQAGAVYHRCTSAPADSTSPAPDRVAHQPPALAAVFRIALHNGRDLWLECMACHTRWSDMAALSQVAHLTMPCRRMTRFERFCQEHRLHDSCYILIRYGSGHIERLQGIITVIDHARQRVQVTVTHSRASRIYWRHFGSVYFGTLEVHLTPEQYARLLGTGVSIPATVSHGWYTVADTPDMRVLLRQCGVRY